MRVPTFFSKAAVRAAASALIVLSAGVFGASANPDGENKVPMDHDVYDSWEKVASVALSDDGRILVYQVNPQEGDGRLVVRKIMDRSGKAGAENAMKSKVQGTVVLQDKEIVIPRGYMATIDPEGAWVYCRIAPEFAKARDEKIKKVKKEDRTKDTLAVINLATMEVKKYPGVISYITGLDAKPIVAFKTTAGSKSKTVNAAVVLNPNDGNVDTLKHVEDFAFSRNGKLLVLTTKKSKNDSTSVDAVILKDYTAAVRTDTLDKDHKQYCKPVFSEDGRKIAFSASSDTNKTGGKRFSLFLTELPDKKAKSRTAVTREIFKAGAIVPGTDNWTVTDRSEYFFSMDGSRLFAGIAPVHPQKDTTIVDFETAQLDIWNWDSPYTPPQQKIRLERTLDKTALSVINLASAGDILPLAGSLTDEVTLAAGGNAEYAMVLNNDKYVRNSVWNYKDMNDLYLVSLKDGVRRIVKDSLNADVRISPAGKYLLWYDMDDSHYHTFNISTGRETNITKPAGVNFFDEENDRPTAPYPYDSSPKWLENDEAVLIADRYDIWKFNPDGKKYENLTKSTGRNNHLKFRILSPEKHRFSVNAEKSSYRFTLKRGDGLLMSVFDENTMKNGVASVSVSKPSVPQYFTDTVSFVNIVRAAASGTLAFGKGNFRNPYDLYLTLDNFATDRKLTSINPQMAKYRWGRAELFEWKAYDGTPLKGLVFIPDGVKPGDKLPVMVYFYEKYSESLYDFWTPAPSRSTVNIPFYTSRGYICFIPDIVYKTGHPGESAYNCIISGTEALCEKYGIADRDRMAMQGQSWGGYQTAYLITRTDIFKAAGSGAPVGNMTSAYGGVRWESGIVRAGQYEHGQSRIGKNLWDEGGLELYIENSPVFHLDKVTTPVLIMHNDSDGAVPWYQGIEMFSNLRRLGKPAWLLQYNNEEHNLVERRNTKDLSRRLQQFFDHYLKGAPMPAWMKTGVPYHRKGEYFGFENAE